ncbi:MAG: type II/IV secretion system ATPase subunit [Candidatus Nanoarchaeia archaeon]|nr:type II/IV secretion system ATPase subunit [Candidatus Haiyanarchaeum thermophilum]MCW1303157.1 type II/IV secretion system ATPase subunit [Candidatus Haiyanarchaeum thermophilum]MCW1303822.1 type II/IV secretion system ATPase subunit [Candidatus Haiyanarchaeum thermophilum]MCW1306561.1 type II/IV secretion system ATPase subunit [Candidatus Haiyanarchaeum thermophilum]MCW1306975.1 type II/IV secretion system ATPase subunit [Candidatus Haiyanarchaeum thermophilum]
MPRRFITRLGKKLAEASRRLTIEKFEGLPTPPITLLPQLQLPSLPLILPKYPKEKEKKEEREESTKLREIKEKYEPVDISDIEKEVKGEEAISVRILEKLESINEIHPLISIKMGDREVLMAFANIRWDPESRSIVYYVIEPELTPVETKIFGEVKELLRKKLDIDLTKAETSAAYTYLMNKMEKIIGELGLKLTEEQLLKFRYYVYRDFLGLERIEPLMHDPNIEDISCNGVGMPIFVYHRNPLFGEIRTNVVYADREELDNFVLKLAQKCGKNLTVAEPLLDGSLPDGSRVQATLGSDIARRGSNFTIRKFTERPLIPVDLINFGTANAEIFAYLWLLIENGLSILVAGPTASGKTTFLNCLSLLIRPEAKIVSIEDTPELRLPHPNWVPQVARTVIEMGRYGEVTMFDLLRSAIRQRPDYLIVGEVRGKEAYVMFQAMATGHACLGTIHADSMEAVIERLTTKPIDLPLSILESLDVIVFLTNVRREGRYVRRVGEIDEIVGYDFKRKELIRNVVMRWDAEQDRFIFFKSIILDKIREKMGYSIESLKAELRRRVKVIRWVREKGINDYREFSKIISLYYLNPDEVERMMIEGS